MARDRDCKLFKVVLPHLILVAQICVCIIIGSLERVVDALRQVDWFHIKFKSIVGRLSHARFLSSHPNLVITFLFGNIVWESTVANNCIGHWRKTGLQTFKGHPSSSHIGCSDLCLHHYWKFWIELLMNWGRSTDFTSSSSQLLDGYLLQDFGHHISVWQL